MANRFLETNYYKSPFVRGLKGALKGLYSFIICDCTPSGIWAMDMEAASMYIGFNVTEKEFEESFIKKGKAIEISNGKYFFPDFIEHQYPKGLQSTNKAHNNIIKELRKFNLIDDNYQVIKGASKGLPSLQGNGQGNGNNNGNGNNQSDDVFNTMALAENFNGLPDIKIGSVIELLKITKQTTVTEEEVKGLWEVFKIQNLTGKKFYSDKDAVYSHFINWSKIQKFEKNGTGNSKNNRKLSPSEARQEANRSY